MKKLEMSLHNCFGIGKLNCSFDLSNDNVIMIYAPNGSMKTSLTRTFLSLEENRNPEDLVVNSRETNFSIRLEENELSSEQIFVYKTFIIVFIDG